MSRIEINDAIPPALVNNDLIEPKNYLEVSKQLFQSSTLLFLRTGSMIVQVVAKRVILSQQDQKLLIAYGGIAALEDFIFVAAFSSLSYISARVAQTAGGIPF